MEKYKDTLYTETLDEEMGYRPRIKNVPPAHPTRARPSRPRPPVPVSELAGMQEERASLAFTYKAARYERVWLESSLGGFYGQHWFDDVLRIIKGGKEASVYLCTASPSTGADYIAAKVYRPRPFRALKKDHLYREGRAILDEDGNQVLDHGALHAIQKKSAFGRRLSTISWIEYEFTTLQTLHAAGADVPQPFACGNNAILMGYIGDLEVPAPPLSEVELSGTEARALFQRVLHNIELMLINQVIHADLSAYNILYWDGEITLIDFPQAMNPTQSANTYRIFQRDLAGVCEYFAAQGVRSDPRRLAAQLWTAQHYRLTPEIDPRYMDDQNAEDRRAWEKQHKV